MLGIAGNSDPIWQAVLPRLFHHMLIFYDDRATVEKYYPVVKAYIDYLLQGVDGRGVLITPGHDYGDWVAPIGCDDPWNTLANTLEHTLEAMARHRRAS